jgi:hypothetical protein
MRGDSTDNVFSAYPGVRKKGSKNKVGLLEAYQDRHQKGYKWNNLMLQQWTDHEGKDHKVFEDYQRNRILIDLSAQPDEVKVAVDNAIKEQVKKTPSGMVGASLMKFCGRYDLIRISELSSYYTPWMKKEYKGTL